MTFKSNTQISEPNSEGFNADWDLQGFAFDANEGMFIPVSDPVDYFEKPLPSSLVNKL